MSERSNEHPVHETMRVTMDEIRGMVDANTIVGQPIKCDNDTTVIPISKVSFDKFHPLAFDWMNKIYLSLGEKVGNAYKDGLALR